MMEKTTGISIGYVLLLGTLFTLTVWMREEGGGTGERERERGEESERRFSKYLLGQHKELNMFFLTYAFNVLKTTSSTFFVAYTLEIVIGAAKSQIEGSFYSTF